MFFLHVFAVKEIYQVLAKYGAAPAFSAEVPNNSNPYVRRIYPTDYTVCIRKHVFVHVA